MKKEEVKAATSRDIRISMTKQRARKQRQKRIFGLMIFMSSLCVTIIVVVLALFFKGRQYKGDGKCEIWCTRYC